MNTLYSTLLTLHGLLAIAVLVLMPVLILLYVGRKAAVGRVSAIAIPLLHLQFVIGLYLYFAGTNGFELFQVEGVMKDSNLRFYAVEHISTMIIAIVLLSLGRIRLKKQLKLQQKLTNGPLKLFVLGFLLLLSRVPWEKWPFVGQ